MLLGAASIYFKARKLKELSVCKCAKEWNQSDALTFPSHWETVEGRHAVLAGFDFSATRYLWQFLYYADTFAESTIHDLNLTSLSGLGELSQKLNTLLEASSALHKKEYLFSNLCSRLQNTHRYVILHLQFIWVSPCIFLAVTRAEYE